MSQPLLIVLIIGSYFLILLTVAHFCSKGANNSTYFTGNRNMAWPIVAVAMITAPISGITFISVPGMVAAKSYGYLQMCMGFVVGYFLIGWVLVPLFYKRKIVSIYSFLDERFGRSAHTTGAWLFLISEILGVGVRFLVVCMVLQMLVFSPLNLPFALNVAVTMFLIWLYTARGGVKSVVWSDTVKSVCLVISVILCFYIIAGKLGVEATEIPRKIFDDPTSRIFFFNDINDSSYFWKQFLTGIFLVVAMTGLDQDMMQRILACKNAGGARKNLAVSGLLQFVVISLFLALGTLMTLYMESREIAFPEKSDNIFATVAFHEEMPVMLGVLFILGLVSASYSSVGSALTSLTTSYTVDILEGLKQYEEPKLKKIRRNVHAVMALLMAIVILLFYYLNEQDAISALFTLASYSYGPILGLFVFGVFTNKRIDTKYIALVCISAPVLTWMTGRFLKMTLDYDAGFELFLLNTLFTIAGLSILPSLKMEDVTNTVEEKVSA